MAIDAIQMRAARALLNWTASDLANAANVGLGTVRRFERGEGTRTPNNLRAMIEALEKAGVIFVSAGTDGAGVALNKRVWKRLAADPGEAKG